MKRDFTLEDIGNLINTSEIRTNEKIRESQNVTLEAVGKLIDESEKRLETKLAKKLDEKFEESKNFTEQKFQEAKDYAEERFHWLGTRMDAAVERLEDKIDAQGIQMRNGFRDVNQKIDSLARNHVTRIELLEERTF